MNIKSFFSLSLGMLLFASCNSNMDETQNQQSQMLRIQTFIDNPVGTRSVIESTTFTQGDKIGLYLFNAEGEKYVGHTFNTGAVYQGQWALDPNIPLTDTPATVCAYYPYDPNNTSEEVTLYLTPDQETGQTDYLYGQAPKAVSAQSSEALINFKHVLSRITFSISRSTSDPGVGMLSSICLKNTSEGTAISKVGKMDMKTGAVTPVINKYDSICLPTNISLRPSPLTVDLLVMPTEVSENNQVGVSLKIDGSYYLVHLPAAKWEVGQQYTYPVTINRKDSHIEVVPAKVGDYYYNDGSWSTNYDSKRNCIGIVFALSEEKDGDINVSLSESMHGRIAALQDLTATYRWADNTSTDVEGIPNFYLADGKQDGGYLPINGIEGESVTTPQLPYGAYIWPVEKSNQYALTDYAGRSHSSFIEKEYYPAGYACFSIMSEGLNNNEQGFWYLPAIGELARLATACNANLLDPTGDSPFKILGDDYYWSSTEGEKAEAYVWCYYGKYKGILQYQVKDATYKVRPIASF